MGAKNDAQCEPSNEKARDGPTPGGSLGKGARPNGAAQAEERASWADQPAAPPVSTALLGPVCPIAPHLESALPKYGERWMLELRAHFLVARAAKRARAMCARGA